MGERHTHRTGTRNSFRSLALALLASLFPAPTVQPADAADPFYEQLLRRGISASRRGDHVTALRELRVAVFGLLEEPPQLLEGLVHLGISQAAVGAAEPFQQTFLRVVELEGLAQAYSSSSLEPSVREAFELHAVRLMSEQQLSASPVFAPLVERKAEAATLDLPAKPRREALKRKLREEPEEARWPALLARIELERGEEEDALELAADALELDPGNSTALLVRGLASVRKQLWAQAVEALERSGRSTTEAEAAEALLRAYLHLERWDRVSGLAAELPESIKLSRPIQALLRRAESALGQESGPRQASAQPSPGGL